MASAAPGRVADRLVQGATVMVGTRLQGRVGVQESGLARDVVAVPGAERRRAERSLLEVIFFKEILDHCGFPHRCELMRVSIPQTGQDLEIRDAVRQFERAKRVGNWRIAADGYEIVSASTPER